MNRINSKLAEDKKLLSIYFTAGYPELKRYRFNNSRARKKRSRYD